MSIKRIVALLTTLTISLPACLSALPVSAETWNDEYEYVVSDNTVTITKYVGTSTAPVIPEEIEGYPVVAIDDKAYANNDTIKSVVLPDSITTMGTEVFSECSNLRSIVLSNSLTVIPEKTFYFCDLREITLPDSCETIEYGAFWNCSGLETLNIGSGLKQLKTNAFVGCFLLHNITISEENPYLYEVNNIVYNTIGDVEFIGGYDDEWFTNSETGEFTNLAIDMNFVNDFKDITSFSDYSMSALLVFDICLPEGLKHLGRGAFAGNTSLRTVVLQVVLKQLETICSQDAMISPL